MSIWVLTRCGQANCKEIIFDFRNANNTHQQMASDGEGIEVVDECKYLGIIDAKLSWNSNTDLSL